MSNNIKSSQGFTIVELLIVIVVIAILAAISIVAFTGISQRANSSAMASQESQAKKKLEVYKVDNGAYPPDQATFNTLMGQKQGDKIYTTYSTTAPYSSYSLNTSSNGDVGVSLPWTSDGYSGLINYLGTNGGVDSFSNPHPSKVITSQSTTYRTNEEAYRAIDHQISADPNSSLNGSSHTNNIANSWWRLDLGEGKTIALQRFGIIGRSNGDQHPRNFTIQGSNNGTSWSNLASTASTGPGASTWWSIPVTTNQKYRFIQILQTGSNSFGANYLTIGDIELWGVYYQ